MDGGGGGGCCIARSANGYGAATTAYNMSKVDRIMLQFRPIAPKPATGTSSGGSTTIDASCKCSRSGKRKNATANRIKKSCSRKRKGSCTEAENRREITAVTLPLLPETPEIKQAEPKESPMWLNFGGETENHRDVDRSVEIVPTVGSCVTIECVTDTCLDINTLGKTDEEKRINLGRDSCPGFISDGYGRVTWTNDAYQKMVGKKDVMVWLAMKENVPPSVAVKMATSAAFTCRVRLQQYTCSRPESVQTLPCDVWRMDRGGFAWWLDVKAALRLGR